MNSPMGGFTDDCPTAVDLLPEKPEPHHGKPAVDALLNELHLVPRELNTKNEIRRVEYDPPHYDVIKEAVGGWYEHVHPIFLIFRLISAFPLIPLPSGQCRRSS